METRKKKHSNSWPCVFLLRFRIKVRSSYSQLSAAELSRYPIPTYLFKYIQPSDLNWKSNNRNLFGSIAPSLCGHWQFVLAYFQSPKSQARVFIPELPTLWPSHLKISRNTIKTELIIHCVNINTQISHRLLYYAQQLILQRHGL